MKIITSRLKGIGDKRNIFLKWQCGYTQKLGEATQTTDTVKLGKFDLQCQQKWCDFIRRTMYFYIFNPKVWPAWLSMIDKSEETGNIESFYSYTHL